MENISVKNELIQTSNATLTKEGVVELIEAFKINKQTSLGKIPVEPVRCACGSTKLTKHTKILGQAIAPMCKSCYEEELNDSLT